MNGHWICEIEFNPSEWFGFIYQITNLTNNRKYIGKKFFSSKRRKKVTGRKNRKVVIKESDWQNYTSSSDDLNEDIEKLGKENFEFRIIKLCKTKRDLGYEEVRLLFANDVLNAKHLNGEKAFYNKNIMSRWFCNEGQNPKISKAMMGNKNAFGAIRSKVCRQKVSLAQKGIKDGPMSSIQKQKISISMKGKNTWMKGRTPWNKGLSKETNSGVAKISQTKMGHIVSLKTKKKISNTLKQLGVKEND